MTTRYGLGTQNVDLAIQFQKLGDLVWLLPSANPNIGKIEPLAEFKRDGLLAYADGTNWNPGKGKGYYRYDLATTSWVLASNIAGLTATRVVFVDANGIPTTDADMTFVTDTLTVAKIGTTLMTGTTTHTGAMIVRTVNDAGPMTATNGTVAEIVFNSADSKFYGCTVSGTPATWSALN